MILCLCVTLYYITERVFYKSLSAQFRLPEWLFVWSLAGFVCFIRWSWFMMFISAPLPADANTYLYLSQNMSWPYDTSLREPLHVWMIWAWSLIFAPNPFSLRLLSIVTAIALGVVLYYLGRRLFG
jgi:hypothetical protein